MHHSELIALHRKPKRSRLYLQLQKRLQTKIFILKMRLQNAIPLRPFPVLPVSVSPRAEPWCGTLTLRQYNMLAQSLAESLISKHWPPIHLRAPVFLEPLNKWVWQPHLLELPPAYNGISVSLLYYIFIFLWYSSYSLLGTFSSHFILSSSFLPLLLVSPSFHPLLTSLFPPLCSPPPPPSFPYGPVHTHTCVICVCFWSEKCDV